MRELTRALLRLPETAEYPLRLYDVGPRHPRLDADALGLDRAAQASGLDWRRWRVPAPRRALPWCIRTARPRLLHRASAGGPPCPSVRELLPVSELPPEGSTAEGPLRTRLAQAAALLVFSRAAAQALTERYDLAPERIYRVPVGCDHWAREPVAPASEEAPTVLVLGALRSERRPERVLASLATLRAGGRDVRLLWIGRRGDGFEAFERARGALAQPDAARFRDDVRERDMAQTVSRCQVLLHCVPTALTAVTPLEALSLGLGVVASPLPALREDLGDDAVWLEPDSSKSDWADAIDQALRTSSDNADQGRRRASAFTWAANARATLTVWRAALDADQP